MFKKNLYNFEMKIGLKKLFVSIILLLISSIIACGEVKAQSKNIYITLDVSGSMSGFKYDLANYSVQVIAVLNKNNKVNLIVLNNTIELSQKDKYKIIHLNIIEITKLRKLTTHNLGSPQEIGAIDVFNSLFDERKQFQEIFIIGDGIWQDVKKIKDDFLKNNSSGNLRTTFLETLINREIETTDFETFLKDNGIGKIYKVDSANSIIDAINTIAEEITGVSAIPLSDIRKIRDCIEFTLDMDILSFMILYQDGTVLAKIPSISTIECKGKFLSFINLGNPSNETFETKTGGLMSSRIYEVNKRMEVGSTVNICFSDNIDINKLRIFPIVDIKFGTFGIGAIQGKTKQINANSIGVCRDNNSVEIIVDFNQGSTKLTDGSIKKAQVTVTSNDKSYPAKFENGYFKAILPLAGDTTIYQVESELKGYFRLNSGIKKIVKTDCKPEELITPPPARRILPSMDMGSIALDQLSRDGRISGTIVDMDTKQALDPNKFDIEVKNNYPVIFEDVRIEFKEDNTFDLIIEPKGYWCDCFMPDSLILDFYSTPKNNEAIDGKIYSGFETKLKVKIIKNESWFSRCKWLIITMLLSLFLIWFFMRLIKKNRFAKNSKITFKYPNVATMRSLNPQYISTDFPLRKKGLFPWLNRWFNPFVHEQRTLNFDTIGLSLLYTASNSVRYVLFPKSAYNESSMQSINYDESAKLQYVKHDENGELQVTYQRNVGLKTKNFLHYSYPQKAWNDIAAFQTFLRFLIFGLGVYFAVALFFIVKSLI